MAQIVLMLLACSTTEAPAPAPAPEPVAEPAPEPVKVPDLPAVPEGAKVMFTEPADGAKVKSPVKVVFGVENLEVEAAGEVNAGKGHHHLIIDAGVIEPGAAVPKDEKHIHYGQGQTETEVELSPGEHTLTMQFADGLHRSYGEPLSATIKVTVE